MGAHNLADRAVGKTMSEAYDRAVSYAQGEYGRNAYNGTISTTEGFDDKTARYENLVKEHGEKEGAGMWHDEAWDNTDKWGEVWGAKTNKVTENSIEKNLYLFAGWAAE
jgi:hypothetical protein